MPAGFLAKAPKQNRWTSYNKCASTVYVYKKYEYLNDFWSKKQGGNILKTYKE
jgi:hypothetical protein